MDQIKILTENGGGNHLGGLSVSIDYSDLKSLLQIYSVTKNGGHLRKLPIEAAITLSVNDFACRENAIGGLSF